MEHLEAYNRKLLANILPVHVAEHFLNSDKNSDVSQTLALGMHARDFVRVDARIFFILLSFPSHRSYTMNSVIWSV